MLEAITILSAAAAVLSALAAWKASLLAAKRSEPRLVVQETRGPRGPDFHIENVGGEIATQVGFYVVTGGEIVAGNVLPTALLRPGEGGFVRPILTHGYAERAGIIYWTDTDDVLYLLTGDGRRKRFSPRQWFAPWRPAENPKIEDLLLSVYPDVVITEDTPEAPHQWVPAGEQPVADMVVLGFGEPG